MRQEHYFDLLTEKQLLPFFCIDSRRWDDDGWVVTGAQLTFRLVGMFPNTYVLGPCLTSYAFS